MGEWVRYKLDQVTEHVLIDEAQDTNPQQWAIVSKIADEFFVGEGTHAGKTRDIVHRRRLQAGDLRLPGHRPDLFPRGVRAVPGAVEFPARCRVRRGAASGRGIVADAQLPLDRAGARIRRCGDRRAARAGHGHRRRVACQRSAGPRHGDALDADDRGRHRGRGRGMGARRNPRARRSGSRGRSRPGSPTG